MSEQKYTYTTIGSIVCFGCGAPATTTLRDSIVRGQLVHYCNACSAKRVALGDRR